MFARVSIGLRETTAERIVRIALFVGLAALPALWQGQYALVPGAKGVPTRS